MIVTVEQISFPPANFPENLKEIMKTVLKLLISVESLFNKYQLLYLAKYQKNMTMRQMFVISKKKVIICWYEMIPGWCTSH